MNSRLKGLDIGRNFFAIFVNFYPWQVDYTFRKKKDVQINNPIYPCNIQHNHNQKKKEIPDEVTYVISCGFNTLPIYLSCIFWLIKSIIINEPLNV